MAEYPKIAAISQPSRLGENENTFEIPCNTSE